jgi:hypothetical protein
MSIRRDETSLNDVLKAIDQLRSSQEAAEREILVELRAIKESLGDLHHDFAVEG